ncbi:alpha/beta hydrolase [Phenylobacterium sp.]|jgi:pimeloyl-ACP methyl ester carboxylesterase|uniref:alpha/beta fold hydrolase n=1 Tax=Phenylobacterium sp. TaxID=1871053 RepID=UPI002F3FE099
MHRRTLISAMAAGMSAAGAATAQTRDKGVRPMSASPAEVETRDGVRLHVRAWGQGRPVVFVHGWAVTCEVFQYQMAALSAQARCIAYDKRGHGRSSDPGSGYGYDDLADDLAAVLERLDLHDVVVVGHSMGPAEIVRYLSRHGSGRVSRLVLISSALPFMMRTADNPDGIDPAMFAARRKTWVQDMPKFLAENARGFVLPATSQPTVDWLAAMGAQASLKALIDLNHTITETDLRKEVAQVRLPSLVIHGAEDKSAPLDLAGRRTAAMIPGAQLKVYEGAPHGLLLTHADRLNQDLAGWIGA